MTETAARTTPSTSGKAPGPTGYGHFKVFSIVYGMFYTAFFMAAWSPIRYYPLDNQWTPAILGPEAGPAMLWYGWLGSALVASVVLAMAIPRRLSDRIPANLTWILPSIVLVAIFIHERRWF